MYRRTPYDTAQDPSILHELFDNLPHFRRYALVTTPILDLQFVKGLLEDRHGMSMTPFRIAVLNGVSTIECGEFPWDDHVWKVHFEVGR